MCNLLFSPLLFYFIFCFHQLLLQKKTTTSKKTEFCGVFIFFHLFFVVFYTFHITFIDLFCTLSNKRNAMSQNKYYVLKCDFWFHRQVIAAKRFTVCLCIYKFWKFSTHLNYSILMCRAFLFYFYLVVLLVSPCEIRILL